MSEVAPDGPASSGQRSRGRRSGEVEADGGHAADADRRSSGRAPVERVGRGDRHRPPRYRGRTLVAVDLPFLRGLRRFSIVEGISTLVLFGVAMPLKYFAGQPLAVTIAGSVHGALFIGLVAMFLVARWRVPLSTGLVLAGIVGAVLPFGPFVVDRWLDPLARPEDAKTGKTVGGTG